MENHRLSLSAKVEVYENQLHELKQENNFFKNTLEKNIQEQLDINRELNSQLA